jgi:phosphate transport system substrate-binding protein
MAPKNETTTLIATLLVTLGLVGGGIWWMSQKSGINPGQIWPGSPNRPAPLNAPNQPSQLSEKLADVPSVPTGLFNYGGSTTWAPIRKEVDGTLQTVWTGFKLRYTDPIKGAPGSGPGIRMLLDNQLAFAQSSRSLKDEERQKAQQEGLTLKEIPVAIDGIAIVVHPDLAVSGLTIAQLEDIYVGKITNWQAVGGPNLPIVPYSRRIGEGGTIDFFVENVLEKKPFGANVQFISTTTQALRAVAANPGGIYYASAPEAVPQCGVKPLPLGKKPDQLVPPYQLPLIAAAQCPAQRNQLNAAAFQSGEYPITRRLFVIVKQNGQVDQQAGEAYANLLLSNQGQELIAKAGFVRIR